MSNSSNNNNNNGKNNKGKLRRPLSAYNLYFRSEREVIRGEVNQGHAPQDYTKHVDAALKRLKGKQGAAEFQAVASTIAARWKALPAEERTKYEKMADAEMEEYKERKFQYHRNLVKECEMAARGKAPEASMSSSNSSKAVSAVTTEEPSVSPVLGMPGKFQGLLHGQLQRLTPQDGGAASLASVMALPPMPMARPSASAFASSFTSLPMGFVGPFGSFREEQPPQALGGMKDYQGEIFSLREQILRERLLLQARQEEKMRMEQHFMAMQQAKVAQEEREVWMMERQLAMLRQQNRTHSPLVGDEQAKRAALAAALARASLPE